MVLFDTFLNVIYENKSPALTTFEAVLNKIVPETFYVTRHETFGFAWNIAEITDGNIAEITTGNYFGKVNPVQDVSI